MPSGIGNRCYGAMNFKIIIVSMFDLLPASQWGVAMQCCIEELSAYPLIAMAHDGSLAQA